MFLNITLTQQQSELLVEALCYEAFRELATEDENEALDALCDTIQRALQPE